jgi:hypothetical protein
MVNTEVKGTLAKLLATENLNVEHRAVETAYFDIENRVLCLPIWKDVSSSVYDMLVGHEVGHALYTPLDYAEAQLEVPQDILNVLEDVRVEKHMKRRYPGLAKSFFHGYTELDKKNFFELEGKDLSKMALIDRINVHFKIGVIGNRTIVHFERDEMQWINRAADTESFEDVVQLGKELVEFLKMTKQEQVEVPSNASVQDGPTSGQTEGQSQGQSEEEMPGNANQGENFGDEEGGDEQPTGGSSNGPQGGKGDSIDEMTSETYRALAEKQKDLVDKRAKDYLYVNIPQINLNETIVPFKTLFESFTKYINTDHAGFQDARMECTKKYREYKKDSIKSVNYLVKEFECKKAADQYARASTSRTGVLDTARLHTYKFSDDVFKKVTTIPDGKNHGLVFYLDWSGSMANSMVNTVKQLYDLIWFCKKVAIPFRVYGFSDAMHNDHVFPGIPCENKLNDLHIDKNFRLLEFFSSKMNVQTLDTMMEYFYVNCEGFRKNHGYNFEVSLSGTPLVETIVTTPQVVEKFKSEEKVQKVNVIYLSDGEACQPGYNVFLKVLNEKYSQPLNYDKVCVLRDPKTRYSRQINTDSYSLTNEFVKYISNIVDYNLLGFRLCGKSEVRSMCHINDINTEQYEKQWEKQKCAAIPNCGFKELYLIPLPKQSYYTYWNPKEEDADEIVVKDPSSKSQLTNAFKKHMNGKMVNKVILSKFAGQIA